MNTKSILRKILAAIITLVVFPLFAFWIGAGHIGPLFKGEFTQYLGSIEVSYIQMARFIETSWPALAWQPRWYLGYPLTLIYTPLVPVVEFLAHHLVGWSYSHAYRVITAVAYAGGLPALYFFARTLYKNSVAGLFSALCYGILPSIIALLYEEVAADRFAKDIVEPRRFAILVRWGEGPHIVSLFFLPLAAMALVLFLRSGSKWTLISAGILTTLTALTNSIGAWAIAILAFALFIGQLAEDQTQWGILIKRIGLFALFSVGCAAFWYNPLFISTFFREGSGAAIYWRDQFPWGWLMLIGAVLIFYFGARKILAKVPGVSAAMLFFFVMFGIVNTYYSSGAERLELVPQALRLNTEVDMAASLMIGAAVAAIGRILQKKGKLIYVVGMVVALVGLIPLAIRQLALVGELPKFTKAAELAVIDLTKTAEYDVAQKLKSLVTGDERVFVPGNYSFYLNYFTDLPQLRGALFQSSVHPWPDHIYYQVTNGNDGDISVDWLKIANIGWLVYSGPREIFRDYKVGADKFAAAGMDLVAESEGDKYYRVPLKNNSLVKTVPEKLAGIRKPKNAIDRDPISQYVSLLESSESVLTLKTKENGRYEINGQTAAHELVLVQMAYAPGWRAKDSRGTTLEVKPDPLGFILIKPREAGKQNFTLYYSQSWQVWSGWVVTVMTMISALFLLVRGKKALIVPALPISKTKDEDELE